MELNYSLEKMYERNTVPLKDTNYTLTGILLVFYLNFASERV